MFRKIIITEMYIKLKKYRNHNKWICRVLPNGSISTDFLSQMPDNFRYIRLENTSKEDPNSTINYYTIFLHMHVLHIKFIRISKKCL